jgi:Flp pilus assembly protein TadB
MGRRRASVINPAMRISDADRAEVADHLSKQYSEGRLDQAEFDERLDRAMRAKTQSDLVWLLSDLPRAGTARQPSGPPQRRRYHRALLLIVVVVVAFFAWQTLVRPYLAWLLVALLAYLLLLRHGPQRRG